VNHSGTGLKFAPRGILRLSALKLAGQLPINGRIREKTPIRTREILEIGIGEEMGQTRLRGLEIAGVQIGIEVPKSCAWQWPSSRISDYSCLPRDPEVHVGVRVGDVDSTDLAGERYALGSWTFEVARQGEDWVLGLSRAGRREQLAFFDRDFQIGEIVLSRDIAELPVYPLRSPLDEWITLHRVVAGGGLCLNAAASAQPGGACIRLGAADPSSPRGWTTPSTTLLGRNTVWLREVAGRLTIFRTPWGDAMDPQLGLRARVIDVSVVEVAENPYRELLDPSDAAELLVTHAVVPVCDEGLLERVLRNAQRMGENARVMRFGENERPMAPIAWQSAHLQGGFAPPRGVV
jgi:hypothetical protein